MVLEKGGWSIGQAGLDAVTYPLWIAGRFYHPTMLRNAATTNAHEAMFCVPIYVPGPNGCAVDELGLELTMTGTAGGLIRLGMYADLGGQPWDLLVDAGTIDVGYSGWQHVDLDLRLRGWQWLAAAFEDYVAPPTYRDAQWALTHLGFPRPESATIINAYQIEGGRAYVQGGLPARFPTLASFGLSSDILYVPRLMLRAA